MWVARDKDGSLHVFAYKPFRKDGFWSITKNWYELEEDMNYQMLCYDECDITWENEPIEVKIISV